MDEWLMMFQAVQAITRSASSFGDGLEQTIRFARQNTKLCDDPAYWDRVDQHVIQRPANQVIRWAREGLESLDDEDDDEDLESLDDSEGWDFLILDLGDCPEIFFLYRPGGESLWEEDQFRKLLFDGSLVGAEELGDYQKVFGERQELAYHNVEELSDDLLSWNVGNSMDFSGNNGYLLWLAFGSLALIEPLRDHTYCKQILRGRSRLYLLSGYESIFLYLCTVTPEGLLFEGNAEEKIQNLDQGRVESGQMSLSLDNSDE